MKIALLGLVLLAQDGHDSRKQVRPLAPTHTADPSADESPAWLSMQDSTGEWVGNQVTPPAWPLGYNAKYRSGALGTSIIQLAPMRGIRQDLTPCKPAGDSCEHSYLYVRTTVQDGNQLTPPAEPTQWPTMVGMRFEADAPQWIQVDSPTGRIIKLSTTEYERLEGLRKAVRDAEGEIAASHGVRTAPYCESGAALAHADDATFCPGAGGKMEWVKFPDHYEYRGAFLLVNVPEVAR